MEYRYEPEGVCSYEMIFEIENNIIKSLKILIKLLKGIPCRDKGTSCPDQVAKALEQYLEQKNLKI